MFKKEHLLFVVLGGFFITNALIAEFIGVKLFSLEKVLGFEPANLSLLGYEDLSFNMTAGVLLWPVVFIMTDIINEYFGKRGVRILSFLAAAMIAFAFAVVYIAIDLKPSETWQIRNTDSGPTDMQLAFSLVFNQGLWIIAGSLIAFLVGQFVDVTVFQYLRRFTGSRKIWLRATGSTLVSQFIDSFVVLFIAFYLPGIFTFKFVIAIMVVNYIYKFTVAILLTPMLYVIHWAIDLYLGKELSAKLIAAASGTEVQATR